MSTLLPQCCAIFVVMEAGNCACTGFRENMLDKVSCFVDNIVTVGVA
jgi:hypothetical protein